MTPKGNAPDSRTAFRKADRELLARMAAQIKCSNWALSDEIAVRDAANLLRAVDKLIDGQ